MPLPALALPIASAVATGVFSGVASHATTNFLEGQDKKAENQKAEQNPAVATNTNPSEVSF